MVLLQPSAPAAPSRPRGRAEPRLWTPPLRDLTPNTSLGFRAIKFCTQVLGMELLSWQQWWLKHAFEVIGPIEQGRLRYRTILTLVGRQCGKTTLLKAVALWLMFDGRARMVLGAAHSLKIAKEAWTLAVQSVRGVPGLAAEIASVRRTNGEQELELVSGARRIPLGPNGWWWHSRDQSRCAHSR